jgi:polyisoprenoid-binding protein YceI
MKVILAFLLISWSAYSFGQVELDTKSASVEFDYESEKTQGTVSGVKATISLNYSDLASSTVSGTADVTTLSTGNKMRDKHLKSDDFFDSEKYPQMSFNSSSIYMDGGAYKSKGELTIKDITKEVVFSIDETKGALIFTTTIYAKDFDVAIKKDREKSKVHVRVSVPLD